MPTRNAAEMAVTHINSAYLPFYTSVVAPNIHMAVNQSGRWYYRDSANGIKKWTLAVREMIPLDLVRVGDKCRLPRR